MRSRRFMSARMSITRRADLGSSEAIGSSAIRSSAPCSRVRAMAARCCWPPESSEPRLSACSAMPTRSSARMARRFSSVGEAPERALQERHAAEQAEADIGENRQPRHQVELLKDHADARAQLLGRADDPSVLLHRLAEQEDGVRLGARRLLPRRLSIGTSPAIALIKVDLPEPDAPISATISPRLQLERDVLEHRATAVERL